MASGGQICNLCKFWHLVAKLQVMHVVQLIEAMPLFFLFISNNMPTQRVGYQIKTIKLIGIQFYLSYKNLFLFLVPAFDRCGGWRWRRHSTRPSPPASLLASTFLCWPGHVGAGWGTQWVSTNCSNVRPAGSCFFLACTAAALALSAAMIILVPTASPWLCWQ